MSLIISNSTGFFFIRRIDDAAAHLRGRAPITPSGNAFHYSWKKGDLSMQKTGCGEVSVLLFSGLIRLPRSFKYGSVEFQSHVLANFGIGEKRLAVFCDLNAAVDPSQRQSAV